MLDGAARLKDLFAGCEQLGMPALAMTDHGNLYGAFDFAGQATKAGIKPIIGTEAYIAPGSRFDKRLPDGGNAKTDKYSHMTLWAADPGGLRQPHQALQPGQPRGLLLQAADGPRAAGRATPAASSAPPAAPAARSARRSSAAITSSRSATAGEYAEIFGRGNFYVELMQHGIDIEKRTFPQLVQIAKELDLPLVATNDLHYTEQAQTHGPRGAAVRADRRDPG